MENSIVTIVFILLVLSLITEKVTDFIKLNITSMQKPAFPNAETERCREKKIHLLSIVVGIFVAVLTNADFFRIVETATIQPWKGFDNLTILSVFGFIITGLFLSQGSKFFHDLLDTLLYVKNIKKSLYHNQENINYQILNNSSLNADKLVAQVLATDRDDDDDYHK
jgi:hypothetical protein